MTLKMAELALMPSASVNTATTTNPGVYTSARAANLRSCRTSCMATNLGSCALGENPLSLGRASEAAGSEGARK